MRKSRARKEADLTRRTERAPVPVGAVAGPGEERNMSYTVAKGNQRVDPDQVAEAGKIPEGVVDLRSDTVTRPTPEMRRTMAEAEVGDDVYGEDPTGKGMEEREAEEFGEVEEVMVA